MKVIRNTVDKLKIKPAEKLWARGSKIKELEIDWRGYDENESKRIKLPMLDEYW